MERLAPLPDSKLLAQQNVMNTAAILGLSIALSVGAAATTAIVLAPTPQTADPAETATPVEPGIESALSSLREELARQSDRQAAFEDSIEAKLDSLRRQPVATPLVAATQMAGAETEAELDAAALEALAAAEREQTLSEILTAMASTDWDGQAELWTKLKEEGLTEEALAYFEDMAEANPNDPESQFALGGAYIQMIQIEENDMVKGKYAGLADAAFDTTLELDENHLDARRSKAISLAFWPPIFGKSGEAKHHFEVLIDKQLQTDTAPEHSMAYLMLGNLYVQTGEADKAKQIWADGLALFPDDAELSAQLTGAQ